MKWKNILALTLEDVLVMTSDQISQLEKKKCRNIIHVEDPLCTQCETCVYRDYLVFTWHSHHEEQDEEDDYVEEYKYETSSTNRRE